MHNFGEKTLQLLLQSFPELRKCELNLRLAFVQAVGTGRVEMMEDVMKLLGRQDNVVDFLLKREVRFLKEESSAVYESMMQRDGLRSLAEAPCSICASCYLERLMQLAMRGALDEASRLGLNEEGTVTFLKDLGWTVESLERDGLKAKVVTRGVGITEIPTDLVQRQSQVTTATSESTDVSDPKSSEPAD